ncbi:hypothetical protein ES703_06895 [subsurface metagenome]
MAETGGRLGLYVFILVLNLVFPILGYTFTTFGADFEDYDISLDSDTLMMAGITMVDADSNNMTWNGPWVYFEIQNRSTRFRFMEDIRDPWITIIGDGIATQRQTAVSKALDNWAVPTRIPVRSVKTGIPSKAMFNSSIIAEWDSTYNWSRFTLFDGTNVFITPFSGTNITKAVYEDGTLNITVAQTFEESTTFNFWQFIGWYSSLMLGSEAWGLPPVFAWVIRLFSALSILAMILLAKEMIRL